MPNGDLGPARIRRGERSDAAAVAIFAARTFAETFGPDNDPGHLAAHLATAYGSEQQGRELADPDWRTLVVERNGLLCGYSQVRRHRPPPSVISPAPVEIARFYIDRAWHGQGLAQLLMVAARGAARELGGQSVWLGVWEKNPRAIAFYLKCGFHDAGSLDFFVGPDRQTDRLLVASLDGDA